ncbi:Chitin synthase, class 2, partial [Clydaea vesicula]
MSSHPNFTDHLQISDEEANLGFQKYERGYLSTPRNTRFEYDKSSAVVDDDEEEEEDRSLLSPKHAKSFGTLKRGITTLARKAKTITLASSGNFIIKQKIPYQILDDATFKNGEEFETLRYTTCTTDPDRFVEKNYSLRVSNLKRNIEIFVVVTMYNEDENAFNRTLFALAQNIQYLCEKNKYGWDENSWQKVAICIVGDGRSKIHENELQSMVIPPGSTATVGWQQYIVRFMLDLAKFSYPVVLICLFVISFGNRPQAFAGVYEAVMFGFGIIGAAMFGMLVHRLYILLQYSIISPPLDPLMTMLDGLNNEIVLSQLQELGKDPKLQDSAQFLVSNILFNITGVIRPMGILNVKYQQIQAYTYLIALASSFGVYLSPTISAHASFIYQYVSWGTKGDTKVEALPQVQSVTNTDGSVTANINVVSDRNEISALYTF